MNEASTTSRSGWLAGWQLYAVLAGACLAVVWIPLLSLFVLPVYAIGYWCVLSGYLGISWLSPGVLTGVAAAGLARERGHERPSRVGAVVGIVATVLLLATWAAGLAAFVNESDAEGGDAAPTTTATTEAAPEDLVRAGAQASGSIEDVLCSGFSGETSFCVVTFEGPACQLWSVVEGEPRSVLDAVQGATGRLTPSGVRCQA